MFGLAVKTEFNAKPLLQAEQKAAFKNLGHAAASIRKDVISTIEKADGPSAPGTPPHTHKRKFLSRAIAFQVTKDGKQQVGAVVGPMFSVVGVAGKAHEFGGEFRGAEYPARPFMFPGLERGVPRFAAEWKSSITP